MEISSDKILSIEIVDEDTFIIHCSHNLHNKAFWTWGPDQIQQGHSPRERIKKLINAIFQINVVDRLYVERLSIKVYKGKATVYDIELLISQVIECFLDYAFEKSTHLKDVELLKQVSDGQDKLEWLFQKDKLKKESTR